MKISKVLMVEVTEGTGVDDDPYRSVKYFYHADSLRLLARLDEWVAKKTLEAQAPGRQERRDDE